MRNDFLYLKEIIERVVPASGGYDKEWIEKQFSPENLQKILLKLESGGEELGLDLKFAGKKEEKPYAQLPERLLLLYYILDETKINFPSSNQLKLLLFNLISSFEECINAKPGWGYSTIAKIKNITPEQLAVTKSVSDKIFNQLEELLKAIDLVISDSQIRISLLYFTIQELLNGIDIIDTQTHALVKNFLLTKGDRNRLSMVPTFRDKISCRLNQINEEQVEVDSFQTARSRSPSLHSFPSVDSLSSPRPTTPHEISEQPPSPRESQPLPSPQSPLRASSIFNNHNEIGFWEQMLKMIKIDFELKSIRDKLIKAHIKNNLTKQIELRISACNKISEWLDLTYLKAGITRKPILEAWKEKIKETSTKYEKISANPSIELIKEYDNEIIRSGDRAIQELKATYPNQDHPILGILTKIVNFIKGIFNQTSLSQAEHIKNYQTDILEIDPTTDCNCTTLICIRMGGG